MIENKPLNKILDGIIKIIELIRKKSNINSLYLLKRAFTTSRVKLIYLIEDVDWVVNWIGYYLTENLKKLKLLKGSTDRRYSAKNKIIHFGSINCLIRKDGILKLNNSNKHILTIYHISPEDNIERFIPYLNSKLDYVHTSSNITKDQLIKLGFQEDKIVVIPMGVELSVFKQYNDEKRKILRKKFGIPQNKVVIGSFQKDGVGWGQGLKPKSVKGPEIFCEVVRRLSEIFDVHVFLTGPARGFIKKKLNEFSIPYTHIYLKNYLNIVDCYNILDLYLVSSRIEGGPKALLEGMATGVPLVTTNVGIASQIIKNNFNGFIAEIENIEKLFSYSEEILSDNDLKKTLINNGLKVIKDYTWEKLAKIYYQKIYKKLLI